MAKKRFKRYYTPLIEPKRSAFQTIIKNCEQRYKFIETTIINIFDKGFEGERGLDFVRQLNFQIEKYIYKAKRNNNSDEEIKNNIEKLFVKHEAMFLLEEFKELLPAYHKLTSELSSSQIEM